MSFFDFNYYVHHLGAGENNHQYAFKWGSHEFEQMRTMLMI